MVDIVEYQRWARTLWQSGGSDDSLAIAALGLAGEAGEVIEHVKKALAKGKPVNRDIEEELGDVLYYWVTLCDEIGADAGSIMSENIYKLEKRADERGWKRRA